MKRLFFLFSGLISIYSYAQDNGKSKISGLVFGDYYYNEVRDSGATTLANAVLNDAKNLNGFQIRRIYFTYDYLYSQNLETRIRLENENKTFVTSGNLGIYVKDAYIKWKKILGYHSIILGIQPCPTFETAEDIWGGRYLEKPITNQRYLAESRDFGLSITGQTDSAGTLYYQLMIGNNSACKTELDRYKALYGVIRYGFFKHFVTTISVNYIFLPKVKNFYDAILPMNLLTNDKTLWSFFVGYRKENSWSIGMEAFLMDWQHMLNTGADFKSLKSYGLSLFSTIYLNKKISFTGRFDYYEPNKYKESTHDHRYWALFSTNFKLSKQWVISPNVIAEFYEKLQNNTKIKPGITPRITFYWKY